MQLVEEKEAETQKLRMKCLQLMKCHISQQMKQLDEINVRLEYQMKRRLQKEKVNDTPGHSCTPN